LNGTEVPDAGTSWVRAKRPQPTDDPLRRRAVEILERCRGEGPANCVARCPLHVDARGYVQLTREGRFREALQRVREKLPFPGVLGYLCDHPCELHCKRLDRDEAVRIRDIKRFLAEWEPGDPQHRIEIDPPRESSVAVVGAGPAGLLAAHDLALRGYRVTLIEARSDIGGCLVHSVPDWRVPREVVRRDLSVFDRLPLEIRTGVRLGPDIRLDTLRRDHDAVLVLLGYGGALAHLRGADRGFHRTARGTLWADSLTCETGVDGVFAAGESVTGPATVIHALAQGRRAGESAHRYLQGEDLRTDREPPGPLPLRWSLYIDESERKRRERTPIMLRPYGKRMDEADAVSEAERCLDCRCGVCVKDCEFLAKHCASPMELARQVLERPRAAATLRMAYSCNVCSLCATVCPAELDTGEMLAEVRREAVRHNAGPLEEHRTLLRVQAVSRWRPFHLVASEPGRARSRALFFPGCALPETAPRQTLALYDELRRLRPGTGVLLDCCGSVADRLGLEDEFRDGIERIRDQVASTGAEELVTACPDCARTLETRLDHVRVTSVWEWLADRAPVAGTVRPAAVAIHDPCAARHAPSMRTSVRRILERQGIRVEEPEFSGELAHCCGRGAGVAAVDPDLARRIAQRTIESGTLPVVTYCASCASALSDGDRPVHHLLDLLVPGPSTRGRRGGPRGRIARLANRARVRLALKRLRPLGVA